MAELVTLFSTQVPWNRRLVDVSVLSKSALIIFYILSLKFILPLAGWFMPDHISSCSQRDFYSVIDYAWLDSWVHALPAECPAGWKKETMFSVYSIWGLGETPIAWLDLWVLELFCPMFKFSSKASCLELNFVVEKKITTNKPGLQSLYVLSQQRYSLIPGRSMWKAAQAARQLQRQSAAGDTENRTWSGMVRGIVHVEAQ